MNHDQSIIIDEMEANSRKSHQKIGFSDFLPGIILEWIVTSPRSEFRIKLFD